ncbi:signal peptidase I [Enterococcus raffinosus]|uniref:signal peptidase I n=1 Tax=Enterococcus raffinosus TaxID=71452 RepID=UPI003ACD31A4
MIIKVFQKQNRKKVCVLLFIIFLCVIVANVINSYAIHSVVGTSMNSSIYSHNKVLVNKAGALNRYSIIAYRDDSTSDMYIKRIIGCPGDKIVIQNNVLILSLNSTNPFEDIIKIKLMPNISEKLEKYSELPKGCYFVLGDNLKVSKDSRYIGLISQEDIEGNVEYIWK